MPESFGFEYPAVLLLLLLFILSKLFFKDEKVAYYMPHFYSVISHTNKRSSLLSFLKWMMIVFALFSLSAPVYIKKIKTHKSNAIDIVLSLDTSGSMSIYGFNAKDYNQSRLAVVKEVVSDFIATREDDRIGLVLFGTNASIASPLSFDKEAQINIVKQLEVGVLGKSTALVDSILSSVELLKNSKSKSKVIVLLSDGEDSSSKVPLEVVLKIAKKYDIKIYTIKIDESQSDMMKVIALANGAKSFYASSKVDLVKVYKTIESLEKSDVSYKSINVKEHIYFYFLTLSVLSGSFLLLFSKNREIV